MPVVGEGRQKERGAAGNRPHARGKRQTRGKSTARAPLRVGIECGRGERKKEGGGRTSTSAGRSCLPAGRLCRGAGLHLPPSARLLTAPPSGPLPPGMPPASTLLFQISGTVDDSGEADGDGDSAADSRQDEDA